MKLSQLLEGPPDFLDKEMPSITIKSKNFYSEDTVKREFDLVSKVDKENKTYWVAIKKDRSIAVIGMLSKRDQDGAVGIDLVGKLEFKDRPDLSGSKWIDTKANVLQVDSVVVYSNSRFEGLGYDLYKSLVKYGFTLVSDHTQYRGGKALWQKIVKQALADDLKVYVVEDGEPICDDTGEPIVYDSKNIPDDKIWNAPTNDNKKSKYFTLLVLRNKK